MVTSAKRIAALRKALATADVGAALQQVRELIPDDGEGAQLIVVYAYACDLEVNSAGLSVLFDRFDDDELEKCASSLAAIGALRTLGDLRTLEAMFTAALAEGKDRMDASEWVNAQPECRRIDRDHVSHVNEIEQKLLEFCNAHVEELAAGN